MIIQAVQGAEFPRAEVAFEGVPVPSPLSCDCLDGVVPRHCDHWSCDDVVSVKLLDHVIDLLSIQTGGSAATGFQAARGRESEIIYQEGVGG